MSRTTLELFKGSKLRTSIFALIVAIALLATSIACVTPTTPAQPDEEVLIPEPPTAMVPLVTLPTNGDPIIPECDAQEMFILNGQSVCPGDAGNGQQVFIGATGATACSSCHTTDGNDHLLVPVCRTSLPALLNGSWGCPRATIYISRYVTRGVTSLTTSPMLMPVFDDSLISSDELLDLIAYLQGL